MVLQPLCPTAREFCANGGYLLGALQGPTHPSFSLLSCERCSKPPEGGDQVSGTAPSHPICKKLRLGWGSPQVALGVRC